MCGVRVVVVNNKNIKIKIETLTSSTTLNIIKDEYPITVHTITHTRTHIHRKQKTKRFRKTEKTKKKTEKKKKKYAEDEQIKEQPIQRGLREDEAKRKE